MTLDGAPWFVAADACRALGLANPTDAIRPLADKDRARKFLGYGTEANLISEAGLYLLILRAQRRNPAVVAFQDWVTRDVLPFIRKQGKYVMGQKRVTTGGRAI